MKLKRRCVYCNEVKLIHFEKKPPICDGCLEKIKHDKYYVIKLIVLIMIILIIFLLSIFIK